MTVDEELGEVLTHDLMTRHGKSGRRLLIATEYTPLWVEHPCKIAVRI